MATNKMANMIIIAIKGLTLTHAAQAGQSSATDDEGLVDIVIVTVVVVLVGVGVAFDTGCVVGVAVLVGVASEEVLLTEDTGKAINSKNVIS